MTDQVVLQPERVVTDRSGRTQIAANGRLLTTKGNHLVTDGRYRFMNDLAIKDIATIDGEFIYLTDQHVFANAWAARIHFEHNVSNARLLVPASRSSYLVIAESEIAFFEAGVEVSRVKLESLTINDAIHHADRKSFYLASDRGLHLFVPSEKTITDLLSGTSLSALTSDIDGKLVLAGENGLHSFDLKQGAITDTKTELPSSRITVLAMIDKTLWVGSEQGAFSIDNNDQINYYASKRWLVDDAVVDITAGSISADRKEVLILTKQGLAKIVYTPMTLHDKAMHFEDQVRKRHIRHGFNSAEFEMNVPGDLSSGHVVDSDNDGLWTSMYLGSQLFRYAVTGEEDAYLNALESFEAMERLYDINPVEGFPARSYERSGYVKHDKSAWHDAAEPAWDWKGTTSSDEAIGHYFAFSLIVEIIPDSSIKQRAIDLIVALTDHIIENDLYLVDVDGKPTRWGRWHPDYVNGFPRGVGDRKLNSSNIIAFMQTAFHFTGDNKYKKEAERLIADFGYFENLMTPMEEIGAHNTDSLAAMLSSRWNHSDDEMYFLSYWYLYPYAFSAELKDKYAETIKNHWNIERPERDGLWNLCYAMTGAKEFDLDETIWYLQEFPLDLINYTIKNSHRGDIELLPPNFRSQTTKEVLPPDEKPIYKHNTNTFVIDRDTGARRESSGDIYLLPYWMGRYLGVISGPEK